MSSQSPLALPCPPPTSSLRWPHAEPHGQPSSSQWVLMAQTGQGPPADPQKPAHHPWAGFSPKPPATGTAQTNCCCPELLGCLAPASALQHLEHVSPGKQAQALRAAAACSAPLGSGQAEEPLGAATKPPVPRGCWGSWGAAVRWGTSGEQVKGGSSGRDRVWCQACTSPATNQTWGKKSSQRAALG